MTINDVISVQTIITTLVGVVVSLLIYNHKSTVIKAIERVEKKLEELSSQTRTLELESAKLRTHMDHLHAEIFSLNDMSKKIYAIESQAEKAVRQSDHVSEIKRDLDFLHDKVRKIERSKDD